MPTRRLTVTIELTGMRRFNIQMRLLRLAIWLTPRRGWIDAALWKIAMACSHQLARSGRVVRDAVKATT